MKRINKIILVLMLPLILELVVSCCNCIETTYLNYTHCGLMIKNLDNSGASPVVAQSNSISKNAYGIRLSIKRSENYCELKRSNSFFIQSVYATSCDCPPEFQYMPLDSIVSVKLSTYSDFDSEHLAGSDITGLFYVYSGNEFIEISKYLKHVETELYNLMNPTFQFDILLMSPPIIGMAHEFEVLIELSDGRVFKSQTGIINLN